MANGDYGRIDLAEGLSSIKPKAKAPSTVRVLDQWVYQAEHELGSGEGGRVGWLVASTVVTALLQRVLGEDGASSFVLKGGLLLQYRLGGSARTTRDLDGVVRGDMDAFLALLDDAITEPWGPISLSRSDAEEFEVPTRVVNPRRFDVILSLRGRTWRKVQVEISADEGMTGSTAEAFAPPSLAGVGLPTPDELVGINMAYQAAEKIHASTDPHDPPRQRNDRARDVADLILIRDLSRATGSPSGEDVAAATRDIFRSRAEEAAQLGLEPRILPARLVAYPHWKDDYARAAASSGVGLSLDEGVAQVNAWLEELGLWGARTMCSPSMTEFDISGGHSQSMGAQRLAAGSVGVRRFARLEAVLRAL